VILNNATLYQPLCFELLKNLTRDCKNQQRFWLSIIKEICKVLKQSADKTCTEIAQSINEHHQS